MLLVKQNKFFLTFSLGLIHFQRSIMIDKYIALG